MNIGRARGKALMEPSGNGTWSLRAEDGDGEDDINDDDDDGGKVPRGDGGKVSH